MAEEKEQNPPPTAASPTDDGGETMAREEKPKSANEPFADESKPSVDSNASPPQKNATEDPEEQARMDAELAAAEEHRKERLEAMAATHQSFVEYDALALFECIERRDPEKLREKFGSVADMEKLFKTHFTTGIEASSVEARQEQWGLNELEKKPAPTFLEFLIEAFQDKVVLILLAAAAVSIVFGMTLKNPHTGEVERESGWIEGVAIIVSVIIVTLTGSINNYQKAKKFEELERVQRITKVSVVRDGVDRTIDSTEVVPGDIVNIKTGNEISCDMLTIRPQSLKMNEAAITGESDLVEKTVEENPFILSGTFVSEGNARCIVVATGMGSFQGVLKKSLDQDDEMTPLQEHLTDLADQIGYFGLGAAALLIFALSLKEIIRNSTEDDREWSAVNFLNFFLIAVALVAVAIPEGLPLAVTIALAFSMKAMMKDQCMVRVLASCETMGAATTVCSDKTGTLTTNKMTVVQGYVAEEEFLFDGYELQQRDGAAEGKVNVMARTDKAAEKMRSTEEVRQALAEAIVLNAEAAEEPNDHGELVWTGNKTDVAMVQFVNDQLGIEYSRLRNENADRFSYPFSSLKKRMTTLVRQQAGGGTECVLYCKGASEAILEACTHRLTADNTIVPLDETSRKEYDAAIIDMASQGNRTLGIARAMDAVIADDKTSFPKDDPTDTTELVWLGVLGIQDPVRPEVPEAVRQCGEAGLTVRMVTGDNLHTAMAIAKKCGLYNENGFDMIMSGADFRAKAEGTEEEKAELIELLPRLRVLARSSPSDKHVLVGLLKERGDVVAVTGDGTNDAPALKLADVGFAMRSGTDIAMSASAMVLLDDNFASVVNAIKWGRTVNDNVKKFLQFQLAINIGGVLLTIIGSLASENSKEPFTPVQLLWLNLIMDTLAALSLSTELPDSLCLERSPVYKQAPLVTNRMRVFIGSHAFFQTVMILLILFFGHKWFDTIDEPDRCDRTFDFNNTDDLAEYTFCKTECEDSGGTLRDNMRCQQGKVHSTMIFNIFIWFQVFNVVNARKIYGEMNPLEGVMTRSRNLIFIFALIGGLQAIAVEFAGDFMSVTPLSAANWGICIGFGALEVIVGIIVRFIPVEDTVPEEVIERERKVEEMRKALTTKE